MTEKDTDIKDITPEMEEEIKSMGKGDKSK